MRVLLVEFVTAVGPRAASRRLASDASALLPEARAMLWALAADFARLPKHELQVVWHTDYGAWLVPGVTPRQWNEESTVLDKLGSEAAKADAVVLIAPETRGILAEWARCVRQAGGRLLGPDLQLIELAADKHALAQHLQSGGVPVPRGCLVSAGKQPPADLTYPAVCKPVDGAGSDRVRRVATAAEARVCDEPRRWETLVPGLPCSVAVLGTAQGPVCLPACEQRLSSDGTFTYWGGRLPLPMPWARRARELAQAAAGLLPVWRGYLGIDLVLGSDPAGHGDAVIEVNPRLTTSYVGLRSAARTNLAGALLETLGDDLPRLEFFPDLLEFDADGTLRRLPEDHDMPAG